MSLREDQAQEHREDRGDRRRLRARLRSTAAPVRRRGDRSSERLAAVGAPSLGTGTRLALRPLAVMPHHGEFVVGDVGEGTFVAVPEIAISIIAAIRSGRTLGEVADLAGARAGQDVDVLDFAATLIDLGFVTKVDDVPLDPGEEHVRDDDRVVDVLARVAAPAFSPMAWTAYGIMFVACAALFVVDSQYRPHASDLFFLDSPLQSVVAVSLLATLMTVAHEGMHWLAARVEGVPARIRISRRLYLFVLETDLTALWAIPRRRRFGPLLAGLAFDTVLLALLLACRITANEGIWQPSVTFSGLIAALVLSVTLRIGFQFLLFLRTDLYAVFTVWLGCLNLTRVTRLSLQRRVRPLTGAESAELDDADLRDVAVARWYRWIYVGGLALAAWFFVAIFAPWIGTLATWTASALMHASPAELAFWEALVLGCLAFTPLALTLVVLLKERRSLAGGATRRG